MNLGGDLRPDFPLILGAFFVFMIATRLFMDAMGWHIDDDEISEDPTSIDINNSGRKYDEDKGINIS